MSAVKVTGQKRDGGDAVELVEPVGIEVAIEKGEADKDKKMWVQKTRSEALPRVRNGSIATTIEHIFAEPVDDERESNQIDDPQRADLPLVELHAKSLRGEVRAEPAEADPDEEEAGRSRRGCQPAGTFRERLRSKAERAPSHSRPPRPPATQTG